MRHGWRTAAVTVAACALLTGCFGSSSPQPSASHSRPPRSPHSSASAGTSAPTSTGSSAAPTTAPTTGSTGSAPAFVFFPRSNGPHSHNCFTITGKTPVEYLYYPVVIKPSSALTLTTAAVTYADGVQVADAWVAPATATRETGTVDWPPPSTVTQGTGVQWSKRVPAAGAALTRGTWYNVFLHLRVYPDALPLATSGVVLTFTDTSGSHDVTWVDHLAFRKQC